MENPEFLKNKYKGLATSKEVESAAKRERARRSKKWKDLKDQGDFEAAYEIKKLGNDPAALIQNYLDRISRVMGAPHKTLTEEQRERRRQKVVTLFREKLYERFVIKPEEIPEGYFEHQRELARQLGHGDIEIPEQAKDQLAEVIVTDQKTTLNTWLDYLSSPDATYPDWLKYFALRSVLGMSEYDKEKKQFMVRSKGTTKPFPDLNREALAYVLDALQKKYEGKQPTGLEGEEDQKRWGSLMKGENFAKLYAFAIEKVTPAETSELLTTKGRWVRYKKGSDHMPLVKSLQGHGTGWCTAGESTAQTQLKGGDFYVYYSQDKEGEARIPRAAIRMEGDRIAEVRGVAAEQNLDPYIAPVVQAKLANQKEFPDGKAYEKKASDMKKLTEIEGKVKDGEDLTKIELIFLYEIKAPIEGFGYQKDPRIKELIDRRDTKADAPVVLECSADEIAWGEKDLEIKIKANTEVKAYIGPLFAGFFEEAPKSITHVYTAFPEGKMHQESVEIDYKKSWQDQVDAGHYDWTNPEFAEWVKKGNNTKFPQKKLENVSHDLVLLSFPRTVSTQEVEKEMDRLGLEKAQTEDLLALGAKCPELLRKFYIVALGSSALSSRGFTVVPVLHERGDKRRLDLYFCGSQWGDVCRFLARRK